MFIVFRGEAIEAIIGQRATKGQYSLFAYCPLLTPGGVYVQFSLSHYKMIDHSLGANPRR